MTKDIKIYKMLSGEEIITEVISDTNLLPGPKVRNPLRIIVVPSQGPKQGPQVALIPWFTFTDEKEFSLDNSHIIAKMKPTKQFEDEYNKVLSPLALPSQQLILPRTQV